MASRILRMMKIDLKDRKYITKIEDVNDIAQDMALNKDVKAVYLFGSYAIGKPHVLSDIDLCIITNGKEGVDYPITDNLDVSYFHWLPITLQFRVFKEGKPLIIKDKNFLDDLKILTLKRYLDIRPLIKKYSIERFGYYV